MIQYHDSPCSFPQEEAVIVKELDAKAPASAFSGEKVLYGVQDTSLGACMIAVLDGWICGLAFVGEVGLEQALEDLRKAWPSLAIVEHRRATKTALEKAFDIWEGRQRSPVNPVKILLKGTVFQRLVWNALLTIPRGTTTSYQSIAHSMGYPRSVRAVGQAVGSNPIALLIPCHRVLYKNGQLGGYHWGLHSKKRLLSKEGALARSGGGVDA